MKIEKADHKLQNVEAINEEMQRLFDDPENFVSDPNITLSGKKSGIVNKDKEQDIPKRRPLASFHRTHHHHHHHSHHSSDGHKSEGEHKNSTKHRRLSQHHRSRGSHAVKREEYVGKSEYKGQTGDIGIDKEEFERLHTANSQLRTKEEPGMSRDSENGEKRFSYSEENITEYQSDEKSSKPTSLHIEEAVSPSVHSEDLSAEEVTLKDGNKNSLATPRLATTIIAAREANPRATRKASEIKSAGSRQRKKKANKTTIIIRILTGIAAVLLSCVFILLIMRIIGQSSMTPKADDVEIVMPEGEIPDDVEQVEDGGKIVTYKGHKYRWNENITTILILGTDRSLEEQESGVTMAGKNGQADTILVGVVDNKNKKISFINVNRDTIVPVSEYTSDGDYAGDKKMQICLSYAYGKDDVTSCKYTAQAVSKHFYGMPINYYARLSYDVIPVLNDSIGGVTVTVLEDLTAADGSLTKGSTVTLAGGQALTYIRWRNKKIVQTNENRMSRQKQYLYAFMKRTIEATRLDVTLPLGLYANASPYTTSNITMSQITYLVSKVLEYGIADDAIKSIPGQSLVGEGNHVEFYPDETALYETVLGTFYDRVD